MRIGYSGVMLTAVRPTRQRVCASKEPKPAIGITKSKKIRRLFALFLSIPKCSANLGTQAGTFDVITACHTHIFTDSQCMIP